MTNTDLVDKIFTWGFLGYVIFIGLVLLCGFTKWLIDGRPATCKRADEKPILPLKPESRPVEKENK